MSSCDHADAAIAADEPVWAVYVDDDPEYPLTEVCTSCFRLHMGRDPVPPPPEPERTCVDCGASSHATDSVYCPVRQQGDSES